MKMRKLFAGIGLAALLLASCIQDEALNKEAAIDGCTGTYIQQATINAENHTIQLFVSKSTELSDIEIIFQLPDGATITPETIEPGDHDSVYDFSRSANRKFKVVSEDGEYTASYTITVWQTEMPLQYSFETLSSNTPFHIFYEHQKSNESTTSLRLEWASGNPGYKMTGKGTSPELYPTVQVSGGVDGGKAVKLETRDTGKFGSLVGMHIAAGNLFIGSFNVEDALKNARKATQLGYPFFKEPLKLEGWYKFKRGAIFEEKGKPIEGKLDECDIYGVLYEVDTDFTILDGDNSLTSDRIVSMARYNLKSENRLPKSNGEFLPETDSWTKFEFPFEPQNGKVIDPKRMRNGGYKLAIVFSSSVEGAFFKGAIGSTLYIDEVKLTAKEN